MSDDLLCVGTIAGAFGVRGEVRLKSFTSDPYAIADLAPLVNEDSKQEFEVVITGQTKNGLTARMSGIVSKEEADHYAEDLGETATSNPERFQYSIVASAIQIPRS